MQDTVQSPKRGCAVFCFMRKALLYYLSYGNRSNCKLRGS